VTTPLRMDGRFTFCSRALSPPRCRARWIDGRPHDEFLGFHPTGRTVQYVSHEFYRVADGLIAEEWICSDTTTLLGQLS